MPEVRNIILRKEALAQLQRQSGLLENKKDFLDIAQVIVKLIKKIDYAVKVHET